jgi:anti-anti-sigma regulatory factor
MAEVLSLDGQVTLSGVAAVRERLLGALAGHDAVVLDLDGLVDADLSLLQLLEAARVHAREKGKTLRLTAPANPALAALLDRAGFLGRPSADDLDFWFQGTRSQ